MADDMNDRDTERKTTAKPRDRTLRILCALLICSAIAACGPPNDAAGQQWLHGTWELGFNPDHDSEDELVFRGDGSVTVHTEDGRVVSGAYRVNDSEVAMLLNINDKPVDVAFEISDDRSRLIYKTGAYYVRKSSNQPET